MHWRRKWQPTPVLLPGKSHGQRNLVGYGPWGHKIWTEAEDIKNKWQEYTEELYEKILMTRITMMV